MQDIKSLFSWNWKDGRDYRQYRRMTQVLGQKATLSDVAPEVLRRFDALPVFGNVNGCKEINTVPLLTPEFVSEGRGSRQKGAVG